MSESDAEPFRSLDLGRGEKVKPFGCRFGGGGIILEIVVLDITVSVVATWLVLAMLGWGGGVWPGKGIVGIAVPL